MSTDLEFSIKRGADSLASLLDDEDAKELYSQLGEYYPEVARIFHEHGMDIFTPFVADREIFNREIWTVNLKVRDTTLPGVPAVPTLNLKGLPQGLEETWRNLVDENADEGMGSAIGLLGLPPLILPDPEATPRPASSTQLPASYGSGQSWFSQEVSHGNTDSNLIPTLGTISLPDIDDDMVDSLPEPVNDGQASECFIGLAFAVPSTLHLDEVDLQKSNDSRGPGTSFRAIVESKKGKQPETDIKSYDIGILLNTGLVHKQPMFHAYFEDGENAEFMKTTGTMEAIYHLLVDLEATVKFGDNLQIRALIQRSDDAVKSEACNSLVLAFSSVGFEIPEESIRYDVFDQTVLTMRTDTWKTHKDNLLANFKGLKAAQQVTISGGEGVIFNEKSGTADKGKGKAMDKGKGKAVDKGKGRAVDKGKGRAVDKGKGRAVDEGYEEDVSEGLGLERLGTSLGLFD